MAAEGTKEGMFAYAPGWLVSLGLRSWLIVGFVGALFVGLYLFGATAGLMVPLIIAVVIGILFAPLVEMLEKHKIPRAVGAVLVMLLLLLVVVLTIWVTITGVIEQSGEIVTQVEAGIDALGVWLQGLEISPAMLDQLQASASKAAPQLAAGVAGFFSSSLSGLIAFFFGLFIGAFILYYILTDWTTLANWFGDHLGYPKDLGRGIVDDSTAAIRQYFKGLTISSILVAVLIGLAMWLMGLPLAPTIALVTFFTSYVPYLGAIFSGAFAFLVALGSGGMEKALIVLAVVLITQNLVQTIVQNYYASEELDLHPLVTLIATILGSTFAGLLGAMLGAPFAAMGIRAVVRVRDYDEEAAHDVSDLSVF